MSLILEALRKSEAERRRGQTPDLLSDATPAATSARHATPDRNTLFVVAAAVLVALLLAWWWLRPSPQPQPQRAMVDAATVSSAADDSTPAAPAPLAPPRREPPPVATPPAPAPATAPAPPAAVAVASIAPVKPSQAAASPSPDAPPSAPSPPSPAAPEPAAVAAQGAPAFASTDLPLRLSDLSAEERQQLPTLKVSMHMWAPDAGDRFAIIDGTRVNEGDRLGDTTIESIQQDGVMLSWRNRHIRLPIR